MDVGVSGKFSLGSGRKKDKARTRGVPDVLAKGATVWNVQVGNWGRQTDASCISVPARLRNGQGTKEIGHNRACERPKFGHNLVCKRHKIFYA